MQSRRYLRRGPETTPPMVAYVQMPMVVVPLPIRSLDASLYITSSPQLTPPPSITPSQSITPPQPITPYRTVIIKKVVEEISSIANRTAHYAAEDSITVWVFADDGDECLVGPPDVNASRTSYTSHASHASYTSHASHASRVMSPQSLAPPCARFTGPCAKQPSSLAIIVRSIDPPPERARNDLGTLGTRPAAQWSASRIIKVPFLPTSAIESVVMDVAYLLVSSLSPRVRLNIGTKYGAATVHGLRLFHPNTEVFEHRPTHLASSPLASSSPLAGTHDKESRHDAALRESETRPPAPARARSEDCLCAVSDTSIERRIMALRFDAPVFVPSSMRVSRACSECKCAV